MNYDFTAGMEDSLDDVAEGRKDWLSLLDEFYGDFKLTLDQAASRGNEAEYAYGNRYFLSNL